MQAAAIAYAVFGMFEWVSAGGTIDKALIESDSPQIGGIAGFNLHQLVGVTILPLLALMFLDQLLLRPDPRRYQMGSDQSSPPRWHKASSASTRTKTRQWAGSMVRWH